MKDILEALKAMSWPGVAAIAIVCATIIMLVSFGGDTLLKVLSESASIVQPAASAAGR